MTDDKRRDPRVPSAQHVWCEGQGQRALALNVSRSGMCITTEEPREVGEQFKVKFDGDSGTIEVNMEVMWRDEPTSGEMTGMGLRIVAFDKGEDAYARFVQRQLEGGRPSRQAPKPSGPAAVPPAEDTDQQGKELAETAAGPKRDSSG